MSIIQADNELHAEAERLGYAAKRPHEPDPGTVAEKFRYLPETGRIRGPRGSILKLAYPDRMNAGPTLGLWSSERKQSLRLSAARVAFVCQHARWPVGLRFINGDRTDLRASNLREVPNRDWWRDEFARRYPMVVERNKRRAKGRHAGRRASGPIGWGLYRNTVETPDGWLSFDDEQHAKEFYICAAPLSDSERCRMRGGHDAEQQSEGPDA